MKVIITSLAFAFLTTAAFATPPSWAGPPPGITPPHGPFAGPSPAMDLGVAALALVAGAAFLARRKRR